MHTSSSSASEQAPLIYFGIEVEDLIKAVRVYHVNLVGTNSHEVA